MKLQRTDLAVFGASLLWGLNFTTVKIALLYVSPFVMGMLRFSIAALAMVFLLRTLEGSLRVSWTHLRRMMLAGVIGFGAQQICFLYGSHLIDASMVALLTAFTTAIMVVVTSIFFRERITPLMLFGVAVACLGMLCVVFGKGSLILLSGTSLYGFILIIFSGLLAGIAPLLNKKTLDHYSASRVTTWTILVGSCFFFPLGTLSGGGGVVLHLPWQAWSAIVFGALGATAGANMLWNYGIAHIGVVRMTIYSYLAPILGIIFASLLLNEAMTPAQWCGALITLLGIALSQYGKLVSARNVPMLLPESERITEKMMSVVVKR